MATSPCVELIAVTKQYANPAGGVQPAVLSGITLDLAAGESVSVVGPSGSGKSTLLNIIGGLDEPTSGLVKVAGQELKGLGESARAALRCRTIGFIFQAHHLLPHCTALENVLLPTLAAGAPLTGAAAEKRALDLLARVGLAGRVHYRPGLLSGGERQRVAVVRALINRPALVLADEPTGALDRVAADSLAALLVEINRDEGVTLVVATHAVDLAARMTRRLVLADGRLQAVAPAAPAVPVAQPSSGAP